MAGGLSDVEYWAMLAEQRAGLGGLEPTEQDLHAAAVGLASQLYRNTEAVEDYAHASGPWTDEDMLRNNARATEICRTALRCCRDAADSEHGDILGGDAGPVARLAAQRRDMRRHGQGDR